MREDSSRYEVVHKLLNDMLETNLAFGKRIETFIKSQYELLTEDGKIKFLSVMAEHKQSLEDQRKRLEETRRLIGEMQPFGGALN